MSKVNFDTPHEFHTKLGLVFNSSIGIPLLPFVYIALEMKNRAFTGMFHDQLLGSVISYLFPLLAGWIMVHGLRKFRSILKYARNEESLKAKLQGLFIARRSYYLSVGFASLLLALGLFLSTSGVIVVCYVFLLFYMSFQLALPKRYVKDLNLTGEEKDIILNQKDYQL